MSDVARPWARLNDGRKVQLIFCFEELGADVPGYEEITCNFI